MNEPGNRGYRIERKYLYRGFCTVLLTGIASGLFLYVWWITVRYYYDAWYLKGKGNLSMATGIYAVLFLLIGRWVHAFRIGVERMMNIVISQIITAFVVDITEIFVSMAIIGNWRYIAVFAGRYSLLWLVQSVILGGLAFFMVLLYRRLFPPIGLLEIHGDYENQTSEKIDRLYFKYHIEEKVSFDEIEETKLAEKIRAYDAVLINDLPSQKKNQVLKICFGLNKRVYVVPKISDIILKSSEELNLLDTPMFLCRNKGISGWQAFVKRLMDIVVSIIAVIILSPVMVVSALCIHFEDGGPVFFRQDRATKDGKVFSILKFRSMRVGSDSMGVRPTTDNDDRITKTGRVIRAWRIDELPQLFNIIRGDMSLVGPRPERVEHVKAYTERIPEFELRLKMKGGLTGYAQVYGKYNTSALDKLKLDLIYITEYSILMDIQIMIETIKILFLKESTEGFVSSGVIEEKGKGL